MSMEDAAKMIGESIGRAQGFGESAVAYSSALAAILIAREVITQEEWDKALSIVRREGIQ